MKVKYPISLLSAIILSAGIALAQQPAPPPAPVPPDEPLEQNFSILIDGGGFLGVYAENISRDNMSRYHISQVRGVGVTQVIKDSPAEKAGLRKDDVITGLDGESVSYRRAWDAVRPFEPCVTLDPERNPLTASMRRWPYRQIDHLLVRSGPDGLSALDVDSCSIVHDQPVNGVWASDHYGLLADFEPTVPTQA